MSINPFDEIAVEEAIRLKEQGLATEIILVSIGPSAAQETIRHGLALGADRGIHVDMADSPEPLTVAKILKAVADKEQPQLLLLGKQAIDNDCNQVAQMVSALLDWPQSTFVSKILIEKGKCQTTREVDGGPGNPFFASTGCDQRRFALEYAPICDIAQYYESKTKAHSTIDGH